MVKIRVEEGSVFAVGMDGESMEVQEGDEMKARVEKELFLPSGWMGRCRWRTWSRPGLRMELFVLWGVMYCRVELGSVLNYLLFGKVCLALLLVLDL